MSSSAKRAAIVVLGCSVSPRGELSGAAARRVAKGAALSKEHPDALVVTSGGKRFLGVAEARAMGDALVRAGVDPLRLVRETSSYNTRENARYVAQVLRAREIATVHLVTCDFHMERASFWFRREGLSVLAHETPSPRLSTQLFVYRRAREKAALVLDRLM